jgi:hypothetical protein
MLQNLGSTVGKNWLWPINQMISILERIENEIVNNLITKRVVCSSEV